MVILQIRFTTVILINFTFFPKNPTLTKFNLGSLVTSKVTGLPMTGMVVGVEFGFVRYQVFPGRYKRWDSLYPDWHEKLVYHVNFKGGPQPLLSFEEWCASETVPEEYKTREYYDLNVPRSDLAAYPEDDLELLDDG